MVSHVARKLLVVSGFLLAFFSTVFSQGKNTPEGRFSGIATYSSRPIYIVEVTSGQEPYRFLVNDIPLLHTNKVGTITFYANSAILTSGLQEVRIDATNNSSSGGVNIRAKIIVKEWLPAGGMSKDSLLWTNRAIDSKAIKGKFVAKVPYSLKGWSESQAIDQTDTAKLNAAMTWYRRLRQYLQQNKGNSFMSDILPAELHAFEVNYLSREQSTLQHDAWEKFIDTGNYTVAGLEHTRLEISGYGKLIHLVTTAGAGAIAINHKNKRRMTIFDVFLHFPEGASNPVPVLLNMTESNL